MLRSFLYLETSAPQFVQKFFFCQICSTIIALHIFAPLLFLPGGIGHFFFLLFDHVYQNIRKVCHIVVYNHILRLIDFKAGWNFFNSSSKLIMRILPLICSYPHGFNTIIIRRAHKKINLIFPEFRKALRIFAFFRQKLRTCCNPVRFRGMQRCMNKNRAALLLLQNRPALPINKKLNKKTIFAESMHLPAYLHS